MEGFNPLMIRSTALEISMDYHEDMMDRKKVLQFAKTHGYDSIHKCRKIWNGYVVYEPLFKTASPYNETVCF